MLARLRTRLTYANVMATIAVFIALGGSSYAALKINGSDIKNRTIGAKKVKKDTLTGTEIKESTLGKVPSANAADNAKRANNAKTANNANTVNGLQVKNFFMKGGANTPTGTVLNVDGIVVKAGCDGSTDPIATVENDSGVGASLRVSIAYSVGTSDQSDGTDSFGTSTFDLTLGNATSNGNGEFAVARSDGKVVTGSYMFRNSANFSGESVCTVNGTAIAS
jgi:hypothetical protein